MHLQIRPLDDATWPGPFIPDDERSFSRFKASWSDTVALLDREVDTLANGNHHHTAVVLEVPYPASKLYRDGTGVHADAKAPRHPGVALSFDTDDHGPMRFCTDTFRGHGFGSYLDGWRANVRAIALGLEALRQVDRYGITRRGEQYRGWQAIGSGDATPLGALELTREEAARILADATDGAYTAAGLLVDDCDAVAAAYRVAAKALHPDRWDGRDDGFVLATRARDRLTQP